MTSTVPDLSQYDPAIQAAATEWGQDPAMLKALILQESAGKSGAVSGKGARGLTQIMPDTAKHLGMTDPTDPTQQIFGAAKYLAEGYAKEGTPEGALLYYHGGPDWRKAYGPESQGYVPGVAAHYQQFTAANNNAPAATNLPAAATPDANAAFLASSGASNGAATAAPAMPDTAAFLASTGAAPVAAAPTPKAPDPEPASDPNRPPGLAPLAERLGGAALQGAQEGFEQGPLGLSPEAVAGLRRIGVYGPSQGGGNMLQTLNEGVISPIAGLVDLARRGGGAVLRGAQGLVTQAGVEAGQPQLGRDIAGLPEAFPFGLPGVHEVPSAPPVNALRSVMRDAEPASPARISGPAPTADPTVPGQMTLPGIVADPVEATAPQPGMVRTAPADASGTPGVPNSVGAAATTPGEGASMTSREALAVRTQGERERFNTPARGQDTTPYVPGVIPTEAEVAADPVVSLKQTLAMQHPDTMQPIQKQLQANNDARVLHYEDVAGSAPELNRLKSARSDQANVDSAPMQNNPQPVTPTAVNQVIDGQLSDPRLAPRDSIIKMITDVKKKLTNPDGTSVTDPNQLYGVGEHINDLMDRPAMREDSGKVAMAQLTQIKNALYNDIERTNPSFATYRQNYANASSAIDGMQFLQDNRAGLTNAAGTLQPGKFNTLMKNIVEDRASGDPTLPAAKLTDEQMNNLFNLHSDLKRLGNIDLSTPRSSPTNMLQQATKLAARGALHVAVMPLGGLGNVAVEMGAGALGRRAAQNRLQGILRPDPRKYPPQTLN